MLKVTFNFDPETQKVSDVSVVESGKTVATKTKTTTKAKGATDKILLKGSSLKLNQDVLDLLGVSVGDRLCVSFNPEPVLVRPDIANQTGGGNLITKSLTLSVKGKTGEAIANFGDEFDYKLESEGFLLMNNKESDDNIADGLDHLGLVDKPLISEIEKCVLDDEDFTATIEGGEEIDFSLELI